MKCFLCFLFFICLFTSGPLKAQIQKFEVKGEVIDSLTLQPEPYVTIRIFRLSDHTQPISAFVSSENGVFCTSLPGAGEYRIWITCVGREAFLKDFCLTEHKPVVNLGSIKLQEDIKLLAGARVEATKPLVKAEVDKTTYNLEDDPDSKSNTLLEMLRKVPLVTVDGQDYVKVNGSSSFIIYINGKPSNMLSNNPKEVLRSIPANTIKKVEVITDPGARYDAEGVSGVLNIVTKGADFEGYNLNLNTLLFNLTQMYGGYGVMKYGKLSLSANYTFSRYQGKRRTDYDRQQFHVPDETFLHTESDIRVVDPAHYGSLEASYELDTLNLITVSGSLDNGLNKIRSTEYYEMSDLEYNSVYAYAQTGNSRQKYGHNSLKADYQHQFRGNKKEMLTFSYQYDHSPNDRTRLFYLSGQQGDSPSLQYLHPYNRQINHAKGQEHTLQLDYVNPFHPHHNVEGGMKYIRRNNVSHATSEMKEAQNDNWQSSLFQPFVSYTHVQNILAAYAGYAYNSEKWGMNSGLRMEHTWQNVDYKEGEGAAFRYRATDWIPSFTLFHKSSDHQQIRLSYNIRLRRPGIGYLNPYVLISGTSLTYGNPELVSEKHHRVSLVYSYFSSRLSIQATALYSLGKDGIGIYQFIDPDGVQNKTYDNMERTQGGGITAYASYNPTSRITLSLNGMLQYLDVRTENSYSGILSGIGNQGFCGSVAINYTQRLKGGWRLNLSGGGVKPEPTIGTDSPFYYFYGVTVAKTFLKERLTLALRGNNLFESYHIERKHEWYADYQATERTRMYGRMFGITVSYRFGDLKEKVRRVARSIENDDVKNAGK